MPDTENPAKPLTEAEQVQPTAAVAEITEQEYHEIADQYLDNVVGRFEELQDQREDIDVEFSVRKASRSSLAFTNIPYTGWSPYHQLA